jgi:hypothetical protein
LNWLIGSKIVLEWSLLSEHAIHNVCPRLQPLPMYKATPVVMNTLNKKGKFHPDFSTQRFRCKNSASAKQAPIAATIPSGT